MYNIVHHDIVHASVPRCQSIVGRTLDMHVGSTRHSISFLRRPGVVNYQNLPSFWLKYSVIGLVLHLINLKNLGIGFVLG